MNSPSSVTVPMGSPSSVTVPMGSPSSVTVPAGDGSASAQPLRVSLGSRAPALSGGAVLTRPPRPGMTRRVSLPSASGAPASPAPAGSAASRTTSPYSGPCSPQSPHHVSTWITQSPPSASSTVSSSVMQARTLLRPGESSVVAPSTPPTAVGPNAQVRALTPTPDSKVRALTPTPAQVRQLTPTRGRVLTAVRSASTKDLTKFSGARVLTPPPPTPMLSGGSAPMLSGAGSRQAQVRGQTPPPNVSLSGQPVAQVTRCIGSSVTAPSPGSSASFSQASGSSAASTPTAKRLAARVLNAGALAAAGTRTDPSPDGRRHESRISLKAYERHQPPADKATTYVVMIDELEVYRSCEGMDVIRRLMEGDRVEAAGDTQVVEGYEMLPIKPRGAVVFDFLEEVGEKARPPVLAAPKHRSEPRLRSLSPRPGIQYRDYRKKCSDGSEYRKSEAERQEELLRRQRSNSASLSPRSNGDEEQDFAEPQQFISHRQMGEGPPRRTMEVYLEQARQQATFERSSSGSGAPSNEPSTGRASEPERQPESVRKQVINVRERLSKNTEKGDDNTTQARMRAKLKQLVQEAADPVKKGDDHLQKNLDDWMVSWEQAQQEHVISADQQIRHLQREVEQLRALKASVNAKEEMNAMDP